MAIALVPQQKGKVCDVFAVPVSDGFCHCTGTPVSLTKHLLVFVLITLCIVITVYLVVAVLKYGVHITDKNSPKRVLKCYDEIKTIGMVTESPRDLCPEGVPYKLKVSGVCVPANGNITGYRKTNSLDRIHVAGWAGLRSQI